MKEKYFIGIDLGIEAKWWQKVLIWFGFRDKWSDKSCMIIWKRHPDGKLEAVDINNP